MSENIYDVAWNDGKDVELTHRLQKASLRGLPLREIVQMCKDNQVTARLYDKTGAPAFRVDAAGRATTLRP